VASNSNHKLQSWFISCDKHADGRVCTLYFPSNFSVNQNLL
jgi:invasion protein IalB